MQKIAGITLAYLMLNAGVWGWMQVAAASENKMHPEQMVMAHVQETSGALLEISLLGKTTTFHLAPLQTTPVRTLLYACADPILLWISAAAGFLETT
jgi:hypothetical protein